MRWLNCFFVVVVSLGLATVGPGAAGASMADIPAPLNKTVACMVRVLNLTPGIDQVRLQAVDAQSWNRSQNPADNQSWVHPVLDYRVLGNAGERQTMRFDTERSTEDGRVSYWFTTILDGLSVTGGPPPSDWGTGDMARKWKTQCGANANAVFD